MPPTIPPDQTAQEVQRKPRAQQKHFPPAERILRGREVAHRVGLSRATIWRSVRARQLPSAGDARPAGDGLAGIRTPSMDFRARGAAAASSPADVGRLKATAAR